MKKTIQAHAPRVIAAIVLSLIMIVALSAAAFADAPQSGPQDGFWWNQQMDGPQSGFGRDQQMGGPQGDFGGGNGFGGNGLMNGQEPPEKPEGDEDRTPPAGSWNSFSGNVPMDRDGRDPMNRIITAVNELEDENVRADIESLMKAHLDAIEAERNAEDDEARAEAAQTVDAARDALNQALTDAGIEGMEAPAGGQEPSEKPDGDEGRMPPSDNGSGFDRDSGMNGQQPEKPDGETQAVTPELPEDENGMYRLFQQFLEWLKGNSIEEK